MNHITSICLTLTTFVMLNACTSEPQFLQLGESFDLSYQEKKTIPSEQLEIQFVRVLIDSRCPATATCISQGGVLAEIQLWKAGQDLGVHLISLGFFERNQIVIDNYQIRMEQIEPGPQDPEPQIAQEAYTITLRVSKP